MRCFASICSSSTQSSVIISYAFCLNWPNNHICKMRYMRPEHAAIAHIFQGTPKNVLKNWEKLQLIRLRALFFVAKSSRGVWEKQFYKSLELGNSGSKGGGRIGWLQLHAGQRCNMHCIAFANICILHVQIFAYCMRKYWHIACMQICQYVCATAWVKNECVSVPPLVSTIVHIPLTCLCAS